MFFLHFIEPIPRIIRNMNLRDLEYLVALDKYKHFRKAAEACYVSQPTLSGQLKKLEQHLGVQLVERGRRQKVLMTPVGRRVVERARRVLQESAEIEQIAQLAQDPLTGKLHLALIPTLAPYLLPRIVPRIHHACPKLELLLYEVQTAPMLQQITAGELDLGLLALPIHSDGLNTENLFEEPFFLLTHSQSPLAAKSEIQVSDLQNETILLLDDGHCFRDQALEICYSGGAQEKDAFRGTSLETLKHMVAARSGSTLVPQLAIPQEPVSEQLHYIPFAAPSPIRTIGLVYRKESARRETFETIAELIRNLNLPHEQAA